MEFNLKNLNLVDRDETIIIEYDNLIQIPEFFLFNKIRNDKYFNDILKLDLFSSICDKSMKPIIMQRNEKNILKWLSNGKCNGAELESLYNELYYKYDDMYETSKFTDFAYGTKNLLLNNFIKKIIIHIEDNDERKIKKLCKLYDNKLDKIVVNTSSLEDLIQEHREFTSLIHSDSLKIKKIINSIDNVEEKSFILPYFGYLFEQINEFVISKQQLEILAEEKKCSVGFIKPINLDESYFYMG